MNLQVNFPSSQVSASRQAAVALEAGFVSQFLEPAAVRNAAASFCLVRGGRQIRGRPAWSARSGLHSFFFIKVSGLSGTLHVIPLLALCCLTPRSRRGPTSKPQARAVGGRIFHRAGLAFCCRPRLSSNVRHHKTKPVASPAGSAAHSAEDQTAANSLRHSFTCTAAGKTK